jgi:hypothetical protein
MNVITMESETFKKLMDSIENLKKTVEEKLDKKTNNNEWLDNQDVCQILKVTTRTLQNYRDQGLLSFSIIGSKILYRKVDVDQFLMDNYKQAFKKK